MIVIVAGMHRSGTSAMAGFLHKNGVKMGRESDLHPRPKPENPKGFYENILFRKLNDNWLRKYSNGGKYLVKKWAQNPPILTGDKFDNQDIIKGENLISFYADHWTTKNGPGIWGWKDPRNCLTMGAWIKFLGNRQFKVIIMERDPEMVAKSMKRRRNCSMARGVALTGIYMDALNEQIKKHKVSHKRVNFDDFIENPDDIGALLAKFLGKKLNIRNKENFIDPTLRHWKTD